MCPSKKRTAKILERATPPTFLKTIWPPGPGWTSSEEDVERPQAGPSTRTWLPPSQAPELAQFRNQPHQHHPTSDEWSLFRPSAEIQRSTHIPVSWVLSNNAYGNRPPIEIKWDLQQGLDAIQEEPMAVKPPMEPPRPTNEEDDIRDVFLKMDSPSQEIGSRF